MVFAAPQEGALVPDPVGDLEPEAVHQEPHRRAQIGGAGDDVTQPARGDPPGPHDAGRPPRPVDPARSVVRGRRPGRLDQPVLHRDRGPDPGDRIGGLQGPGIGPVGGEPGAGQSGGDAGDVVLVVDADPQLDQAPGGRVADPQLLAAVRRRERAVGAPTQAELLVVVSGLRDVRHADLDVGQPVQAHDATSGAGAGRWLRGAWPCSSAATKI